jgi:hypothetical protein
MDTWIVMGSVRRDNELVRHLRIVKSRGMAHSNQLAQIQFTSRGVQVCELLAPAIGRATARKEGRS